eukprot:TRINITY_DN3402_c0_g1_i1.p1 TRINITY_DN3402_c0_g1~~TRINITY_DN3402_c0_g1_i1.p1  ORF type:complete len:519 (+),score=156.42 TRINITY_DN3402_c0_g1_i1:145-1701(+)
MLSNLRSLCKAAVRRSRVARGFSQVVKSAATTGKGVARPERYQFNNSRLVEFGELPFGEIPDALAVDRPFNLSTLSNGVRVCTESWSSELATVAVFINTGSRYERIETSGVAHFLEHLMFKGTSRRTRAELEVEVENFGGQLNAYTSRENTSYTMTVFKDDVPRAVDILGDMLLNSKFDQAAIEAERETIYRECLETSKDQFETTLENVHYTSFRDHMMGQPILGIRENIATINQEQIREFHAANYIGPNIVVVGTGNIQHERLVELVEKSFGSAPAQRPSGLVIPNTEKPYFTPSVMMVRDDEMANLNVGVFFNAPSWNDPDYYAFLLLQRVLGEYTADKYTGHHLNSADRQYNTIHGFLGQNPDISIHKAVYAPYSDSGIFGSYFHGNEVFAYQMLHLSQIVLSEYASYINVSEVFRARNKLWLELLQHETSNDVAQSIGNQILYLNRRVPRGEIAKRVSSLTPGHISRVANRWFFDNELSVVCWGPTHSLMSQAHYNRPLRRSTLGWYGNAHYFT